MTNLRHPSSWRDALTQTVAYLGKPEVARLMGKSEDIVDKLVNPNVEGYHLPVQRALTLDAALVAQGFPAVFGFLFAAAADAARPDVGGDQAPVDRADHEMVARITTDAAKVLDGFLEADKDKVLARDEKQRMLKATALLQERIAAFRRRLFR